MEKTISTNNLTKYKEIMERYKNGEFGEEDLSLHEILLRAGEPNLLRQMSLEELEKLVDSSYGISRALFITLRKELESQKSNGCSLKKENKK